MARTELPYGVILPAEYSDDWYEDMTSNLTKLDDVIGSDSEKLNSNDVAFLRMSSAALTDGGTGNFSDLNSSNKLKTGDYVLDSGRKLYQVVSVDSTNETFTVGNSLFKITAESDLAPVAESGDYDDLDNKPDLNPYDQHIADTDIHVTTADKNKWNNGVSQSYVLRYSSTAITDNSTIAYSTLDNTDNIKASDKIIDSDGKIFSIVSVDTANQTVTVGSALIDLALDANVVHTSGNETVGGQKTFTNSIILQNGDKSGLSRDLFSKSQVAVLGDAVSGDNTRYRFVDKNNNEICYIRQRKLTNSNTDMSFCVNNIDNDNNSISAEINFVIDRNNDPRISPSVTDSISLGRPIFRWKSIYSNSYYYGNVEFSTKFVTTDTPQTITETKTFTNTIKSQKEIEFTGNRLAYILPEFSASYSGLSLCTYGSSGAVKIGSWKVDDNDNTKHVLDSSLGYLNISTGSANSVNIVYLTPKNTTNSKLGDSTNKWKEINGLTPSSLSLPSDRSARVDISGYITNLGNGDTNAYTVPANGYIWLCFTSVTGIICYSQTLSTMTNYAQTFTRSQGDGQLYAFFPVRNGDNFVVQIYTSSTAVVKNAYFIPCQGNI